MDARFKPGDMHPVSNICEEPPSLEAPTVQAIAGSNQHTRNQNLETLLGSKVWKEPPSPGDQSWMQHLQLSCQPRSKKLEVTLTKIWKQNLEEKSGSKS